MRLLKAIFNILNHWRGLIEDDVEERGNEDFQQVETLHRDVTRRVSVGPNERVRCTRRHGACGDRRHGERNCFG